MQVALLKAYFYGIVLLTGNFMDDEIILISLQSSGPVGEAKSFTHYEPARYSGPQSDRVAAMKAAFSVSVYVYI